MIDGLHVAVFARAPVAGLTKTRLIPLLGAAGAARLHRQLVQGALATACAAAPGRVTLWCTPDPRHRFFRALARTHGVALATQQGADLGARMHHAFGHHHGPTLLIGSDCPALTTDHLREAAQVLASGRDAVFIPAEDGGYVLVGLRRPHAALFAAVRWGSASVMEQTRQRLERARLAWAELPPLWDVDRPEDLYRLSHFTPQPKR